MTANDIEMFQRVYGLDLVRLPDEDTPSFTARLHKQLDDMSPDRRYEVKVALQTWLMVDKLSEEVEAKKARSFNSLGISVAPVM